ncbi:uncharacterized protein LOC130506352 [Raphanus sativus]|uniref:Uncharacterized protein LOC130506352 n=1 Tax=Raphanus sativus TaxID=3726 RepID=A0A9W3CZN8_RAPSA|nr:uncharacterized protein LOC130506352 [Raphanus sativus]XP_056856971.1 uncharacterized protein LOC130506352 [Raphanus sativus]XP_056856972.1 uncharacterized protein LOC130506352 [Raphanus sativus]
MPPKRGTKRTRTVRARVDAREVVDDQAPPVDVQTEGVPPVAPPIDQAALMQMVQAAATQAAQAAIQQVTQEAARVAAQEATRVAAQEVTRQLAAAQIPAPQIPQVPVHQIPGQQILPPPLPLPQVYPVHDERFYRLTSMMKNMGMEHFVGTLDPTAAYDWKLSLQRKLENIDCPPEFKLRLAMQYLRGDALVWWEGVRLNRGPDILTFADFIEEFDRKYFPKEAMDRKKRDFEHVSQRDLSIKQYEVKFNQLRRFVGGGIPEEELIRKFLDGMRLEIRNRCNVVTYYRLGDLVEKAAEQEAGWIEEQKLLKSVQTKSGKTTESQKKTWDQQETLSCARCHHHHNGECIRCHSCGRTGHMSRNCRFKPINSDFERQVVAQDKSSKDCYGCGQPGHMLRDCPTREHAEDLSPPKR